MLALTDPCGGVPVKTGALTVTTAGTGLASPKSQIDVGAAIIFCAGDILISQRDERSHLSGFWEFPGGKREPHESFEDCVVREIREELNIGISVESYFDTIHYEYAEKIVLLKFYLCRYLGGEVRALGCRQFKWVPLCDLSNYRFPPANEPVLEKLGLLDHSRLK